MFHLFICETNVAVLRNKNLATIINPTVEASCLYHGLCTSQVCLTC